MPGIAARPAGRIVAQSPWHHRFFTRGPVRIALAAETLRIEGRDGGTLAEIPLDAVGAITVHRSWLRSRLTIGVTGGTAHAIGGLGERAAVRIAALTALRRLPTNEQAEAIASDGDATLVLAGAGTGKTAVITGKVAHLVHNLDASPGEILVLAFNNKAAGEIRERLPDGLAADVSTFHAFGLRVIADVSGRKPTVSKLAEDEATLVRALGKILDELLEDPRQSDAVRSFIVDHSASYRSAFDFQTPAEYDDYIRGVELRTLSGDLVKSFEELRIANYLTEHGVRFEYEAPYEVQTATRQHRQYQPDFFLPDHGIYIEHFALNEKNRPPPGWEGYAEGVEWKRSIHVRNGSKLIETYSWQHRRGVLLPGLRAQLEEAGVGFEPISHAKLLSLIRTLARRLISWLVRLVATFLHHAKSSGLTPDELRARARARGDRLRNEIFLTLFDQVRARYDRLLADEGALDFHDLINRAAQHIREGGWQTPYRYVLVDEFQDISTGRMALLQALARGPQDVDYFLVGDDWQSIYRFAGSDVGLVRNCGAYLGRTRERTLSRTFRFADGILGPSTAFVQRNPEQTRRPLRAAHDVEDRGITLVFDPDPAGGLRSALQEIEEITGDEPHSVLVLGRYRDSQAALRESSWSRSLRVEFSTVHQAKGREADYVVVLDLDDARRGFPSRIEDDPLLDIVLPPVSGKAFPFAEERRLFYVAMTRARIGAYLVADPVRPSPFVVELIRESGDDLRRIGDEIARECPRCTNGRLLPSQSRKNLRCSNYPRCEHLAPRCPNCEAGYGVVAKGLSTCTNPTCDRPPPACPSCGMGVLLLRSGKAGSFRGCTEYWFDPPCRYTENVESGSASMRV